MKATARSIPWHSDDEPTIDKQSNICHIILCIYLQINVRHRIYCKVFIVHRSSGARSCPRNGVSRDDRQRVRLILLSIINYYSFYHVLLTQYKIIFSNYRFYFYYIFIIYNLCLSGNGQFFLLARGETDPDARPLK